MAAWLHCLLTHHGPCVSLLPSCRLLVPRFSYPFPSLPLSLVALLPRSLIHCIALHISRALVVLSAHANTPRHLVSILDNDHTTCCHCMLSCHKPDYPPSALCTRHQDSAFGYFATTDVQVALRERGAEDPQDPPRLQDTLVIHLSNASPGNLVPCCIGQYDSQPLARPSHIRAR